MWCGGGSVQPGPSDVLRQQDVIEDPVREITACTGGVRDWPANYRKCLMRLSSGEAVPVSLMPRLRQKQWLSTIVTNITQSWLTREQALHFIWTVQTHSVIHQWLPPSKGSRMTALPHLMLFCQYLFRREVKTPFIIKKNKHKNMIRATMRLSQSSWSTRQVCHCVHWSCWKGNEGTQVHLSQLDERARG